MEWMGVVPHPGSSRPHSSPVDSSGTPVAGQPQPRGSTCPASPGSCHPRRRHILVYERSCSGSSSCSFGTAWTDDSDAPGGHNGIDTRSELLDLLTTTVDPYTGRPLPYQRTQRHIDHLFPLAAAWDMGAAQWQQRKRVAFANDISRNLVVVAGDINIEKGDSTPSEWLPPWKGSRCWYAGRYLSVAIHYDLPISQADWRALSAASRLCPRRSA